MDASFYFPNQCGYCGKRILSFAKNKSGDLPLVFCGGPCETSYNNRKKFDPRFDKEKVFQPFNHSLSSEEVAEKLAKKHWKVPGYYTTEEVQI